MTDIVKAFVPAVLVTYVLASIMVTQAALASVAALGLEIGLDIRLQTTLQDLLGMTASYLPLIAVAFALGLPVAARLSRPFAGSRALLFAVAGFTAIIALHVIMKTVLGISAIGATRTLPGLLGQGLAGAVGGLCYAALRRPPTAAGQSGPA
jgi:prepilin signal peptidase PulO-like enzyme (type II secretory pathway)